ncbi:hypothetical protein [Brevibacterium oceani]|nr:hypothetical protein [Brevibacterium oceani]
MLYIFSAGFPAITGIDRSSRRRSHTYRAAGQAPRRTLLRRLSASESPS